MIKVFIFAILFLTEENPGTTPFFLMVYSDAQPVQFWSIDCETYNQKVHDGVFHRCFCQPWHCDDTIMFQVSDSEASPLFARNLAIKVIDDNSNELLEIPLTADVSMIDDDVVVYNASFVPSAYDICDQKVRFFVYDDDFSENIAHSDCHNISSSTTNTILAEYYHHLNVFGLYYSGLAPKFYLRIPAIFYHERFPEEDEIIELTSEIVNTNGSMRRQRLLDTDFVPYYFHEKVKLMLKHQYVSIYDRLWSKTESYDIQEGNRMYPEKKAKCWLNEKEYVQRSVL